VEGYSRKNRKMVKRDGEKERRIWKEKGKRRWPEAVSLWQFAAYDAVDTE
jgi:hypothetical protein